MGFVLDVDVHARSASKKETFGGVGIYLLWITSDWQIKSRDTIIFLLAQTMEFRSPGSVPLSKHAHGARASSSINPPELSAHHGPFVNSTFCSRTFSLLPVPANPLKHCKTPMTMTTTTGLEAMTTTFWSS